jgi:hypothetical protein
LTFQDARFKLLAVVRNQVHNGEVTERGFARLVGISQPHAHNVLKGVRNLSPEVFDLVLKYLHLSLLDLAPLSDIEAQIARRRTPEPVAEVAFLATPIGPARPWPTVVNWRKSFPLPFPSSTVTPALVMAKLTPDPAITTLASYDIALLDISDQCRSTLSPHGLYVIENRGEALMRYIRPGARRYYLATDAHLDKPAAWEPLRLSRAQLSAAVKARVLWLGRERDPAPGIRPAPGGRKEALQPGRFLYDPISS